MSNAGLIREAAGKAVLKPIPLPRLQDDYILVRTVAIALNPTDWTTLDTAGDNGTLVGCDYAGIVEDVGKDVTRFKKGDRVAGFGHGGNDANPENGAFAKYIAVKAHLQMHIPDDLSFEEACTITSGVAAAGYALYHVLKLPLPISDSESLNGKPILIYGGSTATGTIAIQFAKLSGATVITTCSPHNFALVKDRGADSVFDYRSADVGKVILAVTGGKIDSVLDTVAVESSASISAKAIGPNGGIYCNLLGIDCPRKDVKSVFFLGYSLSGESYIFERETYPADPEGRKFMEGFVPIAEGLLAAGKLKAHPQRVEAGGLSGAIDGMRLMREGKYSGEKFVYRIDETIWP